MDKLLKAASMNKMTKEESINTLNRMSTRDKFEYFRRFYLVPIESCDEAVQLVNSLNIQNKSEVINILKQRIIWSYSNKAAKFVAAKRLRTDEIAIVLHYGMTSMGNELRYDDFDNRDYGNFCFVINTERTGLSEAGSVWFEYIDIGYKAL